MYAWNIVCPVLVRTIQGFWRCCVANFVKTKLLQNGGEVVYVLESLCCVLLGDLENP